MQNSKRSNRLIENPTVLDLTSLPPQGRSFEFSSESGELVEVLADLIQDHPFRVQIQVRPLGNIFEATGKIEAQMDQVCSLCGDDLLKPVSIQFRELLMILDPMGRSTHLSRANHASELDLDAPEVTELAGPEFSIAEFIHELIAVSIPIRVTGRADCETTCDRYREIVSKGFLGGAKPGFGGESALQKGLEQLKLNR